MNTIFHLYLWKANMVRNVKNRTIIVPSQTSKAHGTYDRLSRTRSGSGGYCFRSGQRSVSDDRRNRIAHDSGKGEQEADEELGRPRLLIKISAVEYADHTRRGSMIWTFVFEQYSTSGIPRLDVRTDQSTVVRLYQFVPRQHEKHLQKVKDWHRIPHDPDHSTSPMNPAEILK